ncbi:hypothetical protein FACS1894204_00680 [Synergistales bacterium]|nr:hypothetical protein FACS1894204_00680 [Synergistales bacterium]
MEDGVLLTYAPEETNPDKNFVIGKEDRAGLFMVVKKGSSMDLFSYKPAKNWLFKANFAESFDNNNTIYNIHKYASNLPTQSGKKSDGSIYSTGHNGTLVYGPYNTIKAGKYHLTVMGHIDSVDKAYLDIVSQQGAKQYAFFKLEPSIVASDGIILQEDFVISEDVTDYEVRIFVGEQDNIRFDGYQIELLVTDLNMPPSTEQ